MAAQISLRFNEDFDVSECLRTVTTQSNRFQL